MRITFETENWDSDEGKPPFNPETWHQGKEDKGLRLYEAEQEFISFLVGLVNQRPTPVFWSQKAAEFFRVHMPLLCGEFWPAVVLKDFVTLFCHLKPRHPATIMAGWSESGSSPTVDEVRNFFNYVSSQYDTLYPEAK